MTKKITSIAKKDEFGRRLIEVGELLPSIGKDYVEGLAKCIQNNKHRRKPYFILHHAEWRWNGHCEELRHTFAPGAKKPLKMLNTVCYRVDNKIGRLEEVWVLPVDAPIPDFGETGQFDETLIKSSRGMPIVY